MMMDLGGVPLWTSGKPEGTMVTSLLGGREYLTLILPHCRGLCSGFVLLFGVVN